MLTPNPHRGARGAPASLLSPNIARSRYLDGRVFGTRSKQVAAVGEAEVEDLIGVLLQGLDFDTRDGVVQALELGGPGNGSCLGRERERNVTPPHLMYPLGGGHIR